MWIVDFFGIAKTRYQPTIFRVFQCFAKIFVLFYLGDRYNSGLHQIYHWIGLRENLQETMVFTIKYRVFL